jgi:hypothetical protein
MRRRNRLVVSPTVIFRPRRSQLSVSLCAGAAALLVLAAAADAKPAPKLAKALGRATAPASQLDLVRTIPSPNGSAIYRYRQSVGGIPVLDSDTVLIAPQGARPRLFTDGSARVAAAPKASLSRSDAIAAARRAAGLNRLSSKPDAMLAIARHGGGTLVWQTELTSDDPVADQQVLVDARSGRIVGKTDMLKSAGNITARLYDTNAVMANNGYSGGIKDNKDHDSSPLTSLRSQVVLKNLTAPKGCLKGRWVEARMGAKRHRVCKASRNFNSVTRHDDRFEALMAYYFVNRAQEYIQSLDMGVPINQRRQLVKADAIPDDNSFYSPGDRQMTLGTGGVDDGEDGDVITHEYGHAVQDAQVKGFGSNKPGASFGEGFGDYLAASVSYELAPQPAAPFRDWNPCMFEWDATSYTNNNCARRTNLTLTKNQAIAQANGDPHVIGEAWSSGLWSLRGALGDDIAGRAIMDRVVLESHFMLGKKPTYTEGAEALIGADQLLYGGADCGAIRGEMIDREFLPSTFDLC